MNLKEGHGGVFEVTIDDEIIYTNFKQYGHLPENEEIFQKIRDYGGNPQHHSPFAQRKEQDEQTQRKGEGSGCNCCPGETSGELKASSGCCPTTPDGVSGSGGASGVSRGKTFVFVLVILIAVGVGGYTFSKKHAAENQCPEQPLITFTNEDMPGLSWRNPATIGQPSQAASVSCGVTLSSLKTLDEVAANKEAVFVLLPGEGEETSGNTSSQVNAVVKMLSLRGKRVGACTLEKHRLEYGQLIQQFSVQSLPCVIVAGRGCSSIAVSGEITEMKLLQAFVQASLPASSCGTAKTGSSCCPK